MVASSLIRFPQKPYPLEAPPPPYLSIKLRINHYIDWEKLPWMKMENIKLECFVSIIKKVKDTATAKGHPTPTNFTFLSTLIIPLVSLSDILAKLMMESLRSIFHGQTFWLKKWFWWIFWNNWFYILYNDPGLSCKSRPPHPTRKKIVILFNVRL